MAQTVVGISVIVEARSKLNQQIKSTNQVKEVQWETLTQGKSFEYQAIHDSYQ